VGNTAGTTKFGGNGVVGPDSNGNTYRLNYDTLNIDHLPDTTDEWFIEFWASAYSVSPVIYFFEIHNGTNRLVSLAAHTKVTVISLRCHQAHQLGPIIA
jgi:hypothetical protein